MNKSGLKPFNDLQYYAKQANRCFLNLLRAALNYKWQFNSKQYFIVYKM